MLERLIEFSYRMWQRRRPRQNLPIKLDSKRVYVLPTGFGVFFFIALLVMTIGSLNYNNNMALMMVFLIAALALLSPLYTVRNLCDIELLHVAAEPVFAGESARFVLSLRNDTGVPKQVIWARAEGPAEVSDIAAHGAARMTVTLPTERRGWLALDRVRLYSRFPVGLFNAWSWLRPHARVLVYPRPELDLPPLPRGTDPALGTPERPGDEEWSGLREYAAGDASRIIAWKVSARTDQLVVKTFAQQLSERVELDFGALGGLDTEARLSRLCGWVVEAEREGLSYRLVVPGAAIGPGSGEAHKHECLRALAEFT